MKTYAIVDIETTGTDPKVDRIIQLGCVLIRNGQVIQRFATDVNPDRLIPKQIENLTHISNQRVKKAPYFEDIALTIYNLLADTVFVAHNIYFDYNFLNKELQRCGAPELTIPGIDTVELAQIFLPTEISFRLGDLAESLGLSHENPHQADSDAEVTGALFLYIEAMIKQLPVITVEKIAALSKPLGMQTSNYIRSLANEMKRHPKPLDSQLEVVSGIALRKKRLTYFEKNYFAEDYPKKKKGKEHLFAGKLAFRKDQARLMNLVYRHFTETPDNKNLLIEAATGMGKTIGYLLPLNYVATPEQPAIISTVSLVLQDQLLKKDIPLLNQLFHQPIQATVIKGNQHYIDLQRFKATLQRPLPQKQYALYQSAVLVWLTQTTTGDFDELNLISLNHLLFKEIHHRGVSHLSVTDEFYEQDFLRYLHQRMKESNFLIVNHALLAQESLRENPLLPRSPYLVIDEAHHLPDICERVASQSVNFAVFHRKAQQLLEPIGLFARLEELLEDQSECLRLLAIYQEEIRFLVESQELFLEALSEQVSFEKETIITADTLQQLSLSDAKNIQKIQLYYEEIIELQTQITDYLLPDENKWLKREQFVYTELLDLFEEMQQQAMVMSRWLENWQERYIHWFVPGTKAPAGIIKITDFEASLLPQTTWYQRYDRIIYVGGTLKIAADRLYFPKKMGIPEAPLKILPSPFDYKAQARIFIPSEGSSIPELSSEEYVDYLVKTLENLLKDFNKPVLVLFTSHEILQKVYGRMHLAFLTKGREIFAQGIGGSREKILKRFSQSDAAILFGADSFWEGIDLPGDTLQLVIVTRLPFENPKRPEVQAKNAFLQEKGINPFFQEAIPKAALKLRQGLGRLIRSQQDHGVMILLDRRLLTTKYGKRIRQALPKEAVIAELPLSEISSEMYKFLDKSSATDEN
ncbi:helicase C-terminal domain-containing protein [Enterococcus massiliensis]|uniref:helicase C-terminal domain-containing protein n=1 Tax=Enterococcus massiliensis TaxID=1640685 RepID=UPI00065E8583|nr:helicase C-terminal domain-containing protein [Enterococcus massiliensis]